MVALLRHGSDGHVKFKQQVLESASFVYLNTVLRLAAGNPLRVRLLVGQAVVWRAIVLGQQRWQWRFGIESRFGFQVRRPVG